MLILISPNVLARGNFARETTKFTETVVAAAAALLVGGAEGEATLGLWESDLCRLQHPRREIEFQFRFGK